MNDTVQEDLNYLSSQISSQTRYIAFILIASSFSLIVSGNPTAVIILSKYKFPLLFSSVMGSITLILDLFQYIIGYIYSKKIFDKEITDFSKSNPYYKARTRCFWAKIITILIGAIVFIVILILLILSKNLSIIK